MAGSHPFLRKLRGILRSLDDDALASLANKGLLRRAQKDLGTAPPAIVDIDDTRVRLQLADSTVEVVELPSKLNMHPALADRLMLPYSCNTGPCPRATRLIWLCATCPCRQRLSKETLPLPRASPQVKARTMQCTPPAEIFGNPHRSGVAKVGRQTALP